MNLVEKALELAKRGHEGQYRRDKKTPYLTHPIAVNEIALNYIKNVEKEFQFSEIADVVYSLLAYTNLSNNKIIELVEIVSLNHDNPEDNSDKGFTIDYIVSELEKFAEDFSGRFEKYPPNFFNLIRNTLDALTHRKNEIYLDYILRAKENKIARLVKISDIEHNISTRNGSNTAGEIKKDKLAIEKYELAKYILLN